MQLLVNFLVLPALGTDDSSSYRLATYSSCLYDIMKFRQHYSRDKRNANFDHYLWHKSNVFVAVNSPLAPVKFYNKFYCLYIE